MPATSEAQEKFFQLVKYYKKHGKTPTGAGPPSERMKQAAKSMNMTQIGHFLRRKKKG